jgi:7-keto-8-aminopelargonate synthetase-like enzyme
MDGACAYLDRLISLKKANSNGNIMLIVDDAHGIGTLGDNGRGFCSNFAMEHIDLLIGTLGKALATHGGFICGNKILIAYLEQTVRSQMYTTCLPPALWAAGRASLAIVTSEIGTSLRQKLLENIKNFLNLAQQYNLPVYNMEHNLSPIQVLIFDNHSLVEEIYQTLLANNIMVGRMVYPTVDIDAPRLRISLTAMHKYEHLQLLCASIKAICAKVGAL